jgi:hypothetical protein
MYFAIDYRLLESREKGAANKRSERKELKKKVFGGGGW